MRVFAQEPTEEDQMPPEKPPKNKRGAAHSTPDQQPSLLDQLEPEEDLGRHNHCQPEIENEGTVREDAEREDAEREDGDREDAAPGTAGDKPEQSPERSDRRSAGQPAEALTSAYARYVEIVNDTYNSAFSDAKRQAAFKEAAKAHGVRITDLKRYSTAAALGIPYHSGAESEPGTDDTLPASQTD